MVMEVERLAHVPRTRFTQGALYEIGSAMSFFQIKTSLSSQMVTMVLPSGLAALCVPDTSDSIIRDDDHLAPIEAELRIDDLSRVPNRWCNRPAASQISDLQRVFVNSPQEVAPLQIDLNSPPARRI